MHQMNYKLATNNTIQNTKQLHKCELHQRWSRKMRWSEKHELKPLMLEEIRTQKALQNVETGKLPTSTYRGQGRPPVTNTAYCDYPTQIKLVKLAYISSDSFCLFSLKFPYFFLDFLKWFSKSLFFLVCIQGVLSCSGTITIFIFSYSSWSLVQRYWLKVFHIF